MYIRGKDNKKAGEVLELYELFPVLKGFGKEWGGFLRLKGWEVKRKIWGGVYIWNPLVGLPPPFSY